ncbi:MULTISPECIES: hypothetical protein [unclassified Pannonibacter]|uniref:hypothetical protein n=1 Tax=unclassified Pannonibacter TaxID=2627228 RepID=UPI0016463B77|nr:MULTISPECIES: hypothetical protein [unclassified Pannonibacter]
MSNAPVENDIVLEFNDGHKWRLIRTPEALATVKDEIERSDKTRNYEVTPFRNTGYKQEIPTLTSLVPEFEKSIRGEASPRNLFGDVPEVYFEENDRKGVFALEDPDGHPLALVQLHGIYVNDIAVKYCSETEQAVSFLRGSVGVRLLINRDPMKPLSRDGQFKAGLPEGRKVVLNVENGVLHGSDGLAAYRLESASGEIIQAYYFQNGVLNRENAPAVIRHDQDYFEYHFNGELVAARHMEGDFVNWTMFFENRLLSREDGPAFMDESQGQTLAWAKNGRAHRSDGLPSYEINGQPIMFHENGIRIIGENEQEMPDFKEPIYARKDDVQYGDTQYAEFVAEPQADLAIQDHAPDIEPDTRRNLVDDRKPVSLGI